MRVCVLLAAIAGICGQEDVCGRPCQSDVQCPDIRGNCTYCTNKICSPAQSNCGGGPSPIKDPSKKQYLMIGDSISIGISSTSDQGGNIFKFLPEYESQHDPVNAGPASKGFHCVHDWLGTRINRTWDVVTFNFVSLLAYFPVNIA
jgi:hypothetical protein